VTLDVSDPDSIVAAVGSVEAQHGAVSVLVANAGITRDTLLMRMSDEDIDVVLQTNLAGSIRLARQVLRGMIKSRHGRIIFVSSGVRRSSELRSVESWSRRRGTLAGTGSGVAWDHSECHRAGFC
jgi:3-oxoacyl-[acyl-carrier protein] reductase